MNDRLQYDHRIGLRPDTAAEGCAIGDADRLWCLDATPIDPRTLL